MKKSLSLLSVLLVFLAMGFGDAANQLVSIVEKAFDVSPFVASFVSLFGMIMFGVLSIPTGVMQSKIGKKKMLSIGLIIFLIGAIFPIVSFSFPIILVSVMLMGAGATILQVAGNPLMRDVSSEGKYSSNLSFAQSVKAIGTLSTSLIMVLIGSSLSTKAWFNVNNTDASFRVLFPIFAVILLITLLLVTFFVPNKADNTKPTTLKKCFEALKTPYILMMFFAIFFYCGAEASMFNRIPSILTDNTNMSSSSGNIVLIVALFIGRFLGGIVLRNITARNFLILTVALSIVGNMLLFMEYNIITTWLSFILIGLGFANIFPLIFSMCIDRFPSLSNEISGLMTTAIVGAAFVPLLTGLAASIIPQYAFIVTLACLVYIGFVALFNK